MQSPRRTGSEFEDAAADFLLEIGFTIITRRFKARTGELDLIALDDDLLVFVEVKQRSTSDLPEASITKLKIQRLYSAAREYLSKTDQTDRDFRFDVIAFVGKQIRHHRNVFMDNADLDAVGAEDDPEPYH